MRLAQLLIIKLLAEVIFIAALVINFYQATGPAIYQGWSETISDQDQGGTRGIAGWVVNPQDEASAAPIEVQLYVDDRFAAGASADIPRPDVVAAGRTTNPRCGFYFALASSSLPAGTHAAQVFAVHHGGRTTRRTLLPLGPRLDLTTSASETNVKSFTQASPTNPQH